MPPFSGSAVNNLYGSGSVRIRIAVETLDTLDGDGGEEFWGSGIVATERSRDEVIRALLKMCRGGQAWQRFQSLAIPIRVRER